jgi:hypothetical protein
MARPSIGNGFTLTSIPRGDSGAMATVARFMCVECAKTLDIRVQSDVPLNPQGYAKRAEREGWKADPWKKNRCYCPKCAGPQSKPKNNPDSEIRKVIPLSISPVPREVTADQKQRTRALLDKHFDDGVGMYLDGMSDQRVAEVVGVPRVIVEQIRDAAYGPIKVDPMLAETRQEIAALKQKIEALSKEAATLASKIEKMAAGKAA